MSKPIKKSEIAEKDVYSNIIEGARIALQTAEKLNAELKKTAQISNAAIAKTSKIGNANEIREVEKQMKIANLTKIQAQKLDTEMLKLNAKKLTAERQYKAAVEKTTRAENKSTQATKDQSNAYKQLAKTQRDAKNESKRLGAELLELERKGQKNSRAYRDLDKKYRKATISARKLDKQLKRLDSRVGDNFRSVGNYNKALGGLRNGMAKLGIAFGIGAVIRKTFNIVKDFDQSMQNLQAITQEETASLRELAKELGESTVFTANEAADAMTKLAMAGFNTGQILKATPGVLSLAAAGNLELAESADIATNVLSGFGLKATEIDRVVDVIAKTATSTNTTVQTLGESFKEIAPTANNLNIPIEEVAAAIGLLGNSGIKGTNATTTLNTALNRLAKPTREMSDKMKELNVDFFNSEGQFIGVTETVRVLNEKMKGLTDEQKANAISTLFGAKANKQMTSLLLGQTTAVIDGTEQTLRGAEALTFLTQEYENAGGAAKDMADTQIDSVRGAGAKFNSALEGMILRFADSTNAANGLKNSILFLAENLGTIVSFIGKAIVALTTYKAIQIAVRIQQTLLNKEVLKSIFSFKGLGKAVKTSSGEVSKMGGALRSVGFAVAIGLAIELAQGFFDIATGADKARAATERFNEAVSQGAKFGDDLIEAARKEIKLENQKNELALSGGKIKKAEFEARKKEILENAQRFIRVNIQQANAEKKRDGASKARIAEQNEILKRLFDLRAELNDQIVENTIATNNETNSTKSSTKATKEKAESINDLVAEYERWRDARVALSRTEDTERESIDKSLITNADEAIKQRRRNIAEIKVLNAELFGNEKDLRKARIDQINDDLAIALEATEMETEKTKLRLQAEKDILAIEKESAKKRAETQKELIDIAADYFIKRSEEKIAQIDKEIDAAEKQFNHLQELAANGNIAAEQSLKEQQRLINEANQKKLAEQKRIERIKLAETALTVYSEKVAAGDETPLVSTIADISLLRAFIEALPSFDVGADRLDSKGQNIDGKGGFLAVNHPDEQILTAEQNQRTGFMPAEEKTKLVESYLSGNLVNLKTDAATQIGGAWNVAPLIKEMQGVKDAINNIETSSVDVQGLTNSWITIANKIKKGNKTTINTFKTRYDV